MPIPQEMVELNGVEPFDPLRAKQVLYQLSYSPNKGISG